MQALHPCSGSEQHCDELKRAEMFSALATKDFRRSKLQVRRQQSRQPKDLCGQRCEERLPISSMQPKRVDRPLHPDTKSGISANLSSYGKLSVKVGGHFRNDFAIGVKADGNPRLVFVNVVGRLPLHRQGRDAKNVKVRRRRCSFQRRLSVKTRMESCGSEHHMSTQWWR